MKVLGLALLGSVLMLSPALADDVTATKAAGDFYAFAQKAGSGLPTPAVRGKLAPLLTPHLSALLAEANAGEDKFAAENKDAPPLVEGSLYVSLFEGFTGYNVGACTGNEKTAHCAVNFTYTEKGGVEKDGKAAPTNWTDTLFLANAGDGWKVDDIGYGGTWDFGNKGRLSETLTQVAGFVSH